MPSNSILNIKKDGKWVEIPAIVGSTPNLTIGTVETLPSGSDATATITGDKENPVLNLGIPKGSDGKGGSGEENVIDSISVNGVNVVPDENKNVDIEIPNIYVGDTEPTNESVEVWINPNGESSPIEVPIEKIKVNGELQIPVNKVVDITVPDAYDDTDIRAELSNINTSLNGKLNKTFTGADVANKILSTDEDGNVVLKNSSETAGKSAYEIAVDNGFVGTETEWLESLKGENGEPGTNGYTPVKGTDYWTAEDIAEIKTYCKNYINNEILGGKS